MISQIRAKVGGDRFGDLDGCKLDPILSEVVLHKRRNGNRADRPALEKRLDLTVPFHAIRKANPTGALAWSEHWSHQGKNSGGLDEQPRRTVQQMTPVHFFQSSFEVVTHHCNR